MAQPFCFFISYRRRDTAPVALLLKHEIEKRLQFVRVFVDVADTRAGADFPERLNVAIAGSHATLALIGPEWMPPKGSPTREDDWVTRELLLAKDLPAPPAAPGDESPPSRRIVPLFYGTELGLERFSIPDSLRFLGNLHSLRIDAAGWPRQIGPLVDELASTLALRQRPDNNTYPTPHPAKARTAAISESDLTTLLAYNDYAGWYVDNFGVEDARYLVKTFRFPSFEDAAEFMRQVAEQCSTMNHHPDWRNVFSEVTVSLTTWDARRRVTIFDLHLALFMNKVAERLKGRR